MKHDENDERRPLFSKYSDCRATAIVMVLHKISGFYKKMENWKTSAVSTTDWMVEPKLCKMRDTSDTFVGRAYSNLYRRKPWHRAKRFVGVKFSRSPAFTRNVLTCKYSLHFLLKSEF